MLYTDTKGLYLECQNRIKKLEDYIEGCPRSLDPQYKTALTIEYQNLTLLTKMIIKH